MLDVSGEDDRISEMKLFNEVIAMDIMMREDIDDYMRELRQWLKETEEEGPEEMAGFFSRRLDIYEDHMSVWAPAYERFAKLLPADCKSILDLGCGTGLELDVIFRVSPHVKVTGVDLCKDMLNVLEQKHGKRFLKLVCQDYFEFPMPKNQWDTVISFESLHHFLPDKKLALYRKIHEALDNGGMFILCDYLACCPEEEELLQRVCREKRVRCAIPDEQFIHFDIPLTLEHELELLQKAGFDKVDVVDCINGATMIRSIA